MNVAALGYGIPTAGGGVPDDLEQACRDAGLPLIAVPFELPFIAVTRTFVDREYGGREDALRARVRRNDELVRAAGYGSGLEGMLGVLDPCLTAWVCGPGSQVTVHGPPPGDEDVARLGAALERDAVDRQAGAAVRLGRRGDADAFAPKLKAALGGSAEVVTWRDETADLLRIQAIRRQALSFLVFILMAMAAFSIANTILMAARERVREVGTLRSMGMTEGGVLSLFLLEGSLIGFFGGLLGAVWGGGLIAYWSMNPINFSREMERMGHSLSFSALVYTRFSFGALAGGAVLGLVISVLASIYPARVASRMVPADAVRADT
jgi:hypothetical protein